jgi:hypothetical protein
MGKADPHRPPVVVTIRNDSHSLPSQRRTPTMLKRDIDVGHDALLQPIELKPAETKAVAVGSPTLPLPPPCRIYPDSVPS